MSTRFIGQYAEGQQFLIQGDR